jgi:hypothetical protein
MTHRSHHLRSALGALLLGLVSAALASDAKMEVPASPDPAAVEFLMAASAKDFKASGAVLPIAIRGARVGFLAEAGKGIYPALRRVQDRSNYKGAVD